MVRPSEEKSTSFWRMERWRASGCILCAAGSRAVRAVALMLNLRVARASVDVTSLSALGARGVVWIKRKLWSGPSWVRPAEEVACEAVVMLETGVAGVAGVLGVCGMPDVDGVLGVKGQRSRGLPRPPSNKDASEAFVVSDIVLLRCGGFVLAPSVPTGLGSVPHRTSDLRAGSLGPHDTTSGEAGLAGGVGKLVA